MKKLIPFIILILVGFNCQRWVKFVLKDKTFTEKPFKLELRETGPATLLANHLAFRNAYISYPVLPF